MNFVEKGVKILILTTLSITFRKKKGKKNQKTPRDGPKKARYCSACKNPMKGHKNIKDCPKNKK